MSKKERKLTTKEQRRKKEWEPLNQEFIDNGYTNSELVVSAGLLSVIATIAFVPIIYGSVYLFFWTNKRFNFDVFDGTLYIGLILAWIALIFIHEGIHGLTLGLITKKKFKDIEYGFVLKTLTPYCTCKTPITKMQYIIGAMMPTIWLGFLPFGLGLTLGNEFAYILGLMLIFGGIGDFAVIGKILTTKIKGEEKLYLDHPYKCGLIVYHK